MLFVFSFFFDQLLVLVRFELTNVNLKSSSIHIRFGDIHYTPRQFF